MTTKIDELVEAGAAARAAEKRVAAIREELAAFEERFSQQLKHYEFQKWLLDMYDARTKTAPVSEAVGQPACATNEDFARARGMGLMDAAGIALNIAHQEASEETKAFGLKLSDAIAEVAKKFDKGLPSPALIREAVKRHHKAEAIAEVALVAKSRMWGDQIRSGRMQDLPGAISGLVQEFRETKAP